MNEISSSDSSNKSNRTIKRIDGHYILEEIQTAFSFERGFLYTVKELTINPGTGVREFLIKDRKRLIKPILFLIFTSFIYTILNNVLLIDDGYIKYLGENETTIFKLFEWTQRNYGYSNIMIAIFIGLWTKLFFIKYDFNIFEILILLCFVMGYAMLIFSFFAILEAIINQNVMQIAGMIGVIYTTWAIGLFYGKRKVINYLKAFFAYILGMITFSSLVILIGIAFDLLK
jgi:hypothetical protein